MTVINVEKVGKSYRLGEKKEERYDTFRNMLWNGTRKSIRRLINTAPPPKYEDFWALRDISFDVKQGQRVGIIGRNGAGKSTLLKLLSRITEPTEGRITMRGRVGSLLEVGTGFHPELTGRENIYMNGAVLGMGHREIRSKFDEIVAFAEVEKFLDTPVKRYSSGMYVRLAFAVAAHLEPEILIIDEVLAVGDAAFQQKCMGKMESIGKSGRTILFVSHSMSAIRQTCESCILLNSGSLEFYGDTEEAAEKYTKSASSGAAASVWKNTSGRYSHPAFTPKSFFLSDGAGQELSGISPARNDVWVNVTGRIERHDEALQIGYGLFAQDGQLLYWTCSTDSDPSLWPKLQEGVIHVKSRIPPQLLNEGIYRVDLLASLYHREWLCEPGMHVPKLTLSIEGVPSTSPYWLNRRPGLIAPVLSWEAVDNREGG